jgi:hypothetical protein
VRSGDFPVGRGHRDAHRDGDHESACEDGACPACGHELAEPDPTAEALRTGLDALRVEVGALTGARLTGRRARAELEQEAERLRGELRARQSALLSLERAADVVDDTHASQRDFTRGRCDVLFSRAALTDDVLLEVLRRRIRQVEHSSRSVRLDLGPAD